MKTTVTKTVARNIQISQYTTVGHLVKMLTAAGSIVDADSTAYIFHKDGSYTSVSPVAGDNTKLINSDRVIFTKYDHFDAELEQKLAAEDFHNYLVAKYAR